MRFIGGGGTGATAHAVVSDAVVQEVVIDNPGSGYNDTVRVVIASPPHSPSLTVEVTKVRVNMSVVLGRKYRLDVSTDLQTWASLGAPFLAEEDVISQDFDVTDNGRFFRIYEVQ